MLLKKRNGQDEGETIERKKFKMGGRSEGGIFSYYERKNYYEFLKSIKNSIAKYSSNYSVGNVHFKSSLFTMLIKSTKNLKKKIVKVFWRKMRYDVDLPINEVYS